MRDVYKDMNYLIHSSFCQMGEWSFYIDGKLESVTPEKLFSDTKDKFTVLASPENLVKESTKKKS